MNSCFNSWVCVHNWEEIKLVKQKKSPAWCKEFHNGTGQHPHNQIQQPIAFQEKEKETQLEVEKHELLCELEPVTNVLHGHHLRHL